MRSKKEELRVKKWGDVLLVALLLLSSYFLTPNCSAQAPLGLPVDPHGRPYPVPSPMAHQQYLLLDENGNQLEVQGAPLKLLSNAQINLAGGGTAALVPASRTVTAGAGLSGGGDLTTPRTISMPNVGTAGTYGGATKTLTVSVDAQGRITSITENTLGTMAGQNAGSVAITGGTAVLSALTTTTSRINPTTNENLRLRGHFTASSGTVIRSTNDADSAYAPLELQGAPLLLNSAGSQTTGVNIGGTTDPGTDNLSVEGQVTIGAGSSGTPIKWIKKQTFSCFPGTNIAASLGTDQYTTTGTTVTGAAVGDTVIVGLPSNLREHFIVHGVVTGPNAVDLTVANPTSGTLNTLTSGTQLDFIVTVIHW